MDTKQDTVQQLQWKFPYSMASWNDKVIRAL